MMSAISTYSSVNLFVLLSGALLVGYSAAQLEKLSEGGVNVCKVQVNDKTQYQCCRGWSQVGDQCTKAICTQPCVNGTCTKPDYCSCDAGYHGKQCERDTDCPLDKWGPNGCTNNCECPKNATCSPHSGTCQCPTGWTGKHCEKCVFYRHGNNCQFLTVCHNSGSPAPGGKCICADGYYGERCKHRCPQGRFGHKCSKTCTCLNNTLCSHINGICCPQCYNNATCYPNASCACLPGWTGEKCDKHFLIVQNNRSNCSCVNQSVDATNCQCPTNNDYLPTITTTTKRISNDLKLLSLLSTIPVVFGIVIAIRNRQLFCRKRKSLDDGNGTHTDEQPGSSGVNITRRRSHRKLVKHLDDKQEDPENEQLVRTPESSKRVSTGHPVLANEAVRGINQNKRDKEKTGQTYSALPAK